MPSTCGPNPEVPWRRRQHQCACPTPLVALPICRVSVCVHGGAARGAHAAERTGPASGELGRACVFGS
eukprot:6893251-Prymnesium_polylepis.1